MAECGHDWQDDMEHWSGDVIKGAMRCTKCKELRLQPATPSLKYRTLRVSIVDDTTTELMEALPSPTKAKKLLT